MRPSQRSSATMRERRVLRAFLCLRNALLCSQLKGYTISLTESGACYSLICGPSTAYVRVCHGPPECMKTECGNGLVVTRERCVCRFPRRGDVYNLPSLWHSVIVAEMYYHMLLLPSIENVPLIDSMAHIYI